MEKLNFQEYRDEVAKQLSDKRAEGDVEGVRKDLDSIKQDENYHHAKTLHQLSQKVGLEKIEKVLNDLKRPEAKDDPEKWDVRDVSSELPLTIRFEIDASLIAESNRGTDTEETAVYRSMQDSIPGSDARKNEQKYSGDESDRNKKRKFLNEVSGGRYLDSHNINHSVTGHATRDAEHYRYEGFNRDSFIQPSHGGEYGTNGFWFNDTNAAYDLANKPIAIISPRNPETRKFFEDTFYPPIEEQLREIDERYPGTRFKNFLKLYVNDKGEFDMVPPFDRLFFLAGLKLRGLIFLPFESREMHASREVDGKVEPLKLDVTWKDISDCIIDLPDGKVFTRKYSTDEEEQVLTSQQKYRKWIEDRLGCSLEELDENID